MATTSEVRITVLRKLYHPDLYQQYGTTPGEPCRAVEEGQEFLVPKDISMPPGFCSWAWRDIGTYVVTLARGGDFVGSRPGMFVASCADGYRPVLFKLERI